jgi:hypothetical protein
MQNQNNSLSPSGLFWLVEDEEFVDNKGFISHR